MSTNVEQHVMPQVILPWTEEQLDWGEGGGGLTRCRSRKAFWARRLRKRAFSRASAVLFLVTPADAPEVPALEGFLLPVAAGSPEVALATPPPVPEKHCTCAAPRKLNIHAYGSMNFRVD